MNSSSQVIQKILLPLPIPSSRGCSLLFRPLTFLAVFLLVLRCGGSLTSRRLMPLLHSRPFYHLFPNAHPFWVSCSTLFLVQYFLTKFPSRRAAGDDQFLVCSTIPPGPFLRLTTVLCGYIPLPMPLLHGSRSFHCGLLPRDFLMLCSGLHRFWI
jgi:hypothetical protein